MHETPTIHNLSKKVSRYTPTPRCNLEVGKDALSKSSVIYRTRSLRAIFSPCPPRLLHQPVDTNTLTWTDNNNKKKARTPRVEWMVHELGCYEYVWIAASPLAYEYMQIAASLRVYMDSR